MNSHDSQPHSERPPAIAVHATTPDPEIIEMCAAAGARLYIVDLEHGTSSDPDCAAAVRAGDAFGIAVAVRLARSTLSRVGRLLDAGAAGVIVADVRTAADCAASIAAVFHPPSGRRGKGGCRKNSYGLSGLGLKRPERQQLPHLASSPFLGVQIESNAGLSRLSEILDTDLVGMASIGARDLAADLGRPGELMHPQVEEATRRVAEEAHRRGMAFAHMVRTIDQIEGALSLAPEWLLFPIAALMREGMESFTMRLRGS